MDWIEAGHGSFALFRMRDKVASALQARAPKCSHDLYRSPLKLRDGLSFGRVFVDRFLHEVHDSFGIDIEPSQHADRN